MIFIAKRKRLILIMFLFLLALATFLRHEKNESVFSSRQSGIIVIDAGHGLPDGGAVGMNGSIESTLNIKIARLVEKGLKKKGYSVIMTRTDDNSISDEGKTLAQRKRSDMYKRLEIINSSGGDMFISIHMNKFTDSRYHGAQVIYSDNFIESENLAECLQKKLCDIKENTSKRTHAKAPSGIFLLKNAKIPAVIVECGFLSNYDEEKLLNTEKYQKLLSSAIVKGIENYYKQDDSKTIISPQKGA